jgi:serine/threonine protein kinase
MQCETRIKDEYGNFLEYSNVKIFNGQCKGIWKIDKIIGSGSYGKVYIICDSTNDCSYIAKLVKQNNDIDIEKEIYFQMKANEIELAPKIYQVCLNGTDNNALIIMDKLDKTMLSVVKQVLKSTEMDNDTKMIVLLDLIRNAFRILQLLNSIGIVHGDAHLENFMFNERTKTWQIIDFGLSSVNIGDKNTDYVKFVKMMYIQIGHGFGFDIFKDMKMSEIFQSNEVDFLEYERLPELDLKKLYNYRRMFKW